MNTCQQSVSLALAFGAGMLLATILPCKWVLIISLITIIFLGFSLSRR